MKTKVKPVRATIVWGLIGGLTIFVLGLPVDSMLPWPLGCQLLLWVLLAGYATLLSRWSSKPLAAVSLPLVLLLIVAVLISSPLEVIIATTGILGWIRSGICFNRSPIVTRYLVEIGLGLGASLPLYVARPAAPLTGALGIWLFFLIQALYFVIFDYQSIRAGSMETDPFDSAKMAAEQILSRKYL
jgi:hypothetical protein